MTHYTTLVWSEVDKSMNENHSYLISVVHSHPTASSGEVIHLPLLLLTAIRWGKHNLELARLVDDKVCGSVLWNKNIQHRM